MKEQREDIAFITIIEAYDRADLQSVADRPSSYHAHVAQRIDADKRSARRGGTPN